MNNTTQPQNIELIAKDITYIQRDISQISANIKDLAGVYATKISVDENYKGINSRLQTIEESSNLWKFVSPSLAAILGSVMTFFIISYFSKF